MMIKLFGYRIEIYKENQAERLLQIARRNNIPTSKIGLIKALRIDQPGIGLRDAKGEIERLFEFSPDSPEMPQVKKWPPL